MRAWRLIYANERGNAGIPGTKVFDGEQSRRGYHLNQFCMSLLGQANRDRFRTDEKA